MRVAGLIAVVAVASLGGALVAASPAQAPARATARAAVTDGFLGAAGVAAVDGDGRRERSAEVDRPGLRVREGEALAETVLDAGNARARAVAVARTIDILDGTVTAYGARREARDDGAGGRVLAGRVDDLRIAGRRIGDVEGEDRFDLAGAGRVVVNEGGTALRVKLDRAYGGFPAGTDVRVAVVQAVARDGAKPAAEPAATPKPAAPAKSRAKRRAEFGGGKRAPRVRARLTRHRYAFPVFGHASVADDFGAARQIGDHQGNDLFAAFGAPVLAVADGIVEKVGTLPISGNRLWLRTPGGDEFFYAHMSAFAPAAVNGRRVRAGTVLGFVGNTGDAEPTPPHLHFEIHPGGRRAIDPHAILLAWQDRRDVAAGAWLARYGEDTAERPGALVEVRDFLAE